jgi:hypothetical protein
MPSSIKNVFLRSLVRDTQSNASGSTSLNIRRGVFEPEAGSERAQRLNAKNRRLETSIKYISAVLSSPSLESQQKLDRLNRDLQERQQRKIDNSGKDRANADRELDELQERADSLYETFIREAADDAANCVDAEDIKTYLSDQLAFGRTLTQIQAATSSAAGEGNGDELAGDNARYIEDYKNRLRTVMANLPPSKESTDLLNNLEDQALQDGLPRTMHEVVFERKTEIAETLLAQKLAVGGDPRLAPLEKLPKESYWTLLIDGKVRPAGNKHIYDRSLGYMAGMMDGLLLVVENVGQPIQLEFLQNLHDTATRYVTVETARSTVLGPDNFQKQGFKTGYNGWGLSAECTPQGKQEIEDLRKEINDYTTRQGRYEYIRSDGNATINDQEVPKYTAGYETAQMNLDAAKDDSHPLRVQVGELVQWSLDKYKVDLEAADSDAAKLDVIIDCCRRLCMIHPFADANGRVIMLLMLNRLLLENGMVPTVLDNQGDMIGLGREDIIFKIRQGQRAVEGLGFVRG